MIQLEITVSGRVQGVGFRYFVQQKAKELDIKGWVKNMSTNKVIIRAQAEKNELDTFIDNLKIGPTRARVDNLITSKINVLSDFDNFSVKF